MLLKVFDQTRRQFDLQKKDNKTEHFLRGIALFVALLSLNNFSIRIFIQR